jgi:tight adherence protein B
MAIFIFLLTFLVATGIFLAIWLSIGTEGNQELMRKRLSAVRKAERRGDVSGELKVVRDEMLSSVPWLHRLLLQWAWTTKLRDYLQQAGMKTKPGKILLLCGVLGLVTYLAADFFFKITLIAALIGIGGCVIPIFFVVWKREQRLRKFEEHFPEALDLLGRAVRAGHAFTTGLEMIGKESAEPVGGEFRTAFEEQNFGLPLRDALLNMTERVPIIDVQFFVTALLTQKETGGNLAEILDGLSRVIRERFRIYREVRVRTAQGRLSAAILIGLPIFMMIVLNIISHEYMSVLFTDPLGPKILAIAAILQVIGSVILWRIMQIEV